MRAYRPHDILIAPARASAGLGRLAYGVAVLAIGFVALNLTWFGTLRQLPDAGQIFAEINSGTTVRGMALLLGSFACMLLALGVALRLAHGRGIGSLVGPWRPAAQQAWRVMLAAGAIHVVVLILPMPDGLGPQWAMGLGRWLTLLPLSLGLLALQCGAEELVFRGYMQSQLAARFRSPVIWIGLPSLLFAVLHYDTEVYGVMAGWVVAWSALFGLMAADLTARSGSLGPAFALHLLNNFVAIAGAAPEGHWDGLALMTLPFAPDDAQAMAALLPLEAGMMLCAWLAARLALRA